VGKTEADSLKMWSSENKWYLVKMWSSENKWYLVNEADSLKMWYFKKLTLQ